MSSINRDIHIYGDSHTLGYELDHDRILGRSTFEEKRQLIEKIGLHKAILMWNQKMGRATGTTVYEFVHQWQRDSYARRAFPEAKLRA